MELNGVFSFKISEVSCDSPPTLVNATLEEHTGGTNFNAKATYKCKEGMKFDSGKSEETFVCGFNNWSPAITDCESESISLTSPHLSYFLNLFNRDGLDFINIL